MGFGAHRICRRLGAVLVLVYLLPSGGCIFTVDAVAPASTAAPQGKKRHEVKNATKAHLRDGTVVLFPRGFAVEDGQLRGTGEHYDLARTQWMPVATVPVEQVAALESYQRKVEPVSSALGIVAGGYLAGIGGIILLLLTL